MTRTAIMSYLLRLTSRRAFTLFMLAFGIGSLSTWFGIGTPWIPALVVVFYGSVLLYAAKVLLVTHSDMTNNSPYFLGFLLFLVALLSTFTNIVNSNQEIDVPRLVAQLGSALVATIVGLPFRQALFAYAPGQQDQDVFYRTLEEELRRSASEFRKSQTELVELLHQFVSTRKTLFEDEERAAAKYISGLEKTAFMLDGYNKRYPELIENALSQAGTTMGAVSAQLQKFDAEASRFEPRLITDLIQEISRVKEQFEAVSSNFHTITNNTSELNIALSRLTGAATDIPPKAQVILARLTSVAADAELAIQQRVAVIHKDLANIDTVLTEFVEISSERIAQLR